MKYRVSACDTNRYTFEVEAENEDAAWNAAADYFFDQNGVWRQQHYDDGSFDIENVEEGEL